MGATGFDRALEFFERQAELRCILLNQVSNNKRRNVYLDLRRRNVFCWSGRTSNSLIPQASAYTA